jgi:hypothetical protein
VSCRTIKDIERAFNSHRVIDEVATMRLQASDPGDIGLDEWFVYQCSRGRSKETLSELKAEKIIRCYQCRHEISDFLERLPRVHEEIIRIWAEHASTSSGVVLQ